MSIELFSSKEVSQYTAKINSMMKSEIEAFSDEKIMSCNLEEWAEYYSEKYRIQPIVIFKDNITRSLDKQNIQVYNSWSRIDPYEPKYFNEDGFHIDYSIPFDGDSMLLRLTPSNRILKKFSVEGINEPSDESYGIITFRMVYASSIMKEKGEEFGTFIENQFKSEFSLYEKMISYVNADINSFNASLKNEAMEQLKKRGNKASDFLAISKALQIPMKLSKDVELLGLSFRYSD